MYILCKGLQRGDGPHRLVPNCEDESFQAALVMRGRRKARGGGGGGGVSEERKAQREREKGRKAVTNVVGERMHPHTRN